MKHKSDAKLKNRKFLGIYFKCCKVYGRIYKNKAKTAYQGICPQCGSKVSVAIGEGGTTQRLFIAE